MLGELGSLMKLMGNRDKMQAEAAALAQKTAEIIGEGEAGGVVRVRANGRMQILSCEIRAHGALPEPALLQEYIVSATNAALAQAQRQIAAETQAMAQRLGIPASMLGGLPGFGVG
jgi:DNA-binding protein YbaB